MRDFAWPAWLDLVWAGYPLRDWMTALGVAVLALLGIALLKRLIAGRLARLAARTETEVDDFLVDLIRRTRWFLMAFPAIYLGSLALELSGKAQAFMQSVAILALLLQLALWALVAIEFWVARARRRRLATDAASATMVGALAFVAKLVLWTIVLLLALDNLGVDVTALVTGLGVGGIAVALAVQNILGDLLASLSIVVDKPFVIGDTITVGDFTGKVETIGLKTTRLRSVGGEEISFPNGDLLQSRIRNWARMSERRVVLNFAAAYGTPPEKLARIPAVVRSLVEAQDLTRFDRAHFKGFGATGFDFETVYWILSPDYGAFMDRQQAVALGLLAHLEKDGIELASASKTLLVERPVSKKDAKDAKDLKDVSS